MKAIVSMIIAVGIVCAFSGSALLLARRFIAGPARIARRACNAVLKGFALALRRRKKAFTIDRPILAVA